MTTMTTLNAIRKAQQTWAGQHVAVDRGCTLSIDENLFRRPMHAETLSEFQRGSGDETGQTSIGRKRAKMRSLRSSSILAVNVFDYWRDRDLTALAKALGAKGDALPHSSMSLINVAYNISYGWTNVELQTLEMQMLQPLLNEHPVELCLAGRQAAVCDLLAAEPGYHAAFADAFPHEEQPVTFGNLVKAIAAFERSGDVHRQAIAHAYLADVLTMTEHGSGQGLKRPGNAQRPQWISEGLAHAERALVLYHQAGDPDDEPVNAADVAPGVPGLVAAGVDTEY